jgi:hypothetical protein
MKKHPVLEDVARIAAELVLELVELRQIAGVDLSVAITEFLRYFFFHTCNIRRLTSKQCPPAIPRLFKPVTTPRGYLGAEFSPFQRRHQFHQSIVLYSALSSISDQS